MKDGGTYLKGSETKDQNRFPWTEASCRPERTAQLMVGYHKAERGDSGGRFHEDWRGTGSAARARCDFGACLPSDLCVLVSESGIASAPRYR